MTNHDTTILVDAATAICKKIADTGGHAYFCGGSIRDQIVGHEVKDIDIATDLHSGQVKEIFPDSTLVGECIGSVIVCKDVSEVEVTTYR